MENPLYHTVKIGNVIIPGNLFLAPLAGFTDKAFRSICLTHGASFTYSEMVSAEALSRDSEKTRLLMERADNEKLLGIQIFMSEEDTARRAIPEILKANPTVIDINCGCPVPKVVKNGAGAALMKKPKTIEKIVKLLTNETDIPITVKFRSGWDLNSVNFLEFADYAIRGGASLLTMHARTRSQGYSGEANWELLRELKNNFNVPVIGSGNIFTPRDAMGMLKETGVDGVLFARGAIGNPFIFNRTIELLKTGEELQEIDLKVKIITALDHLNLTAGYKGEDTACREIKKQLCSYTKGEPGSAALRNKIVHAKNMEDYRDIFKEYLA